METAVARTMNIYGLTEELQRLLDIEDETEEQSALVEYVSGQIEKKAEGYGNAISYLEDMAGAAKQRAKDITAHAKALENKAARMRDFLKRAMLDSGIMKINTQSHTFSVAATAGSVEIIEPDIIPARFLTVIPEQYVPDKTAIKEAIKNGEEVPGAEIIPGWALRVK